MSQPTVLWSSYWCHRGFVRYATYLIGTVCICYLGLLPVVFWQQGWQGSFESALAALVCLAPAVVALGVSARFLGTPQGLTAVLLGMMLRAFPPLAVCLLLALLGRGADYFHFICYLLLFYMITLAVETYLSVQLVKNKKSTRLEK